MCAPPPALSVHSRGYFHLIYALHRQIRDTCCDAAELGHHLRGDGINHLNVPFALIYFRDVVILHKWSLEENAKCLVSESCHRAAGMQGLPQGPARPKDQQKWHNLITCYCATCGRKSPFLLLLLWLLENTAASRGHTIYEYADPIQVLIVTAS